jgi:hypothetical protein
MGRTSVLTVILVLTAFAANSQVASGQSGHPSTKPNFGVFLQSTPSEPLPALPNTCSVPPLRVKPPLGESFTIKQVPAERTDQAMVVRPPAPSCDETRVALPTINIITKKK